MTQYQTVTADETVLRDGTIKLHDAPAFAAMRRAGRLAAEILDALVPFVQPGVTTGAIDDLVRQMTLDGGAVPATLGYRGFAHSCCTSINNVICHGIPGDKVLKDGDIVNIDVTPLLDGWHGDSSRMYLGRLFHDAPEGVHAARAGTGPELRPGMCFTIEPMINLGKPGVKMLDDGWTAVTRDRSLSAQFEHSIGITEDGCEIFTLSPAGLHKPPY